MTLDDLKAKLDAFSPVQIEFVARVVESLSNPPSPDIRAHGTWLTGVPAWIEYFGLALSVHHSATTEPLAISVFEAVFRNACDHLKWSMDPPGSSTRRFVDLIVEPTGDAERRLSLKSTAAKNLSEKSLHISKLTEAAWIQDARTPKARREQTQWLFRQYQEAVSHIVMLRAFRGEPVMPPSRYQLVEVPATIFDSIQAEPLASFESDAPKIECRLEGRTVATVAIDRSDAKITLRNIRISACTVHAEWFRTS